MIGPLPEILLSAFGLTMAPDLPFEGVSVVPVPSSSLEVQQPQSPQTGSQVLPPQGGGVDDASPKGKGDFLIRLNSSMNPVGGRLLGVANADSSSGAFQAFGRTGAQGGLCRVHLRLDLPDRVDYAGPQLLEARRQGLKTLLTVVGTPLSNASNKDGPNFNIGMPPWARSTPADMQAWADDCVSVLQGLELEYVLPDYIEVWNEPERAEWFSGTRQEFLDLFRVTALTLERDYPTGIGIGGPGLASAHSRFGGEESLLRSLLRQSVEYDHRIDFLSWHQYQLGSYLRYTDDAQEIRDLAVSVGVPNIKLFISEWNIYPSADGHDLEFDGPHAAANYVAFLSTIAQVNLDGHCFFMLQDRDLNNSVFDLKGMDTGALTRRGIKKPVFRAMELVNPMSAQIRVPIEYPEDELAVSMLATRTGGTLRVAIANDVVPPQWLWARRCRERDLEPGRIARILDEVGWSPKKPPSVDDLVRAGLSHQEANDTLWALDGFIEADLLTKRDRSFRVHMRGLSAAITNLYLFDSTHNNPAIKREEIEPTLQWVEAQALNLSWEAAVRVLRSKGYDPPVGPDPPKFRDAADMAAQLGIPIPLADTVFRTYARVLKEERSGHIDLVNNLPETRLRTTSPSEAGVLFQNGVMDITMEPDSMMVIDFRID